MVIRQTKQKSFRKILSSNCLVFIFGFKFCHHRELKLTAYLLTELYLQNTITTIHDKIQLNNKR